MFEQKGFCGDGTYTLWAKELCDGGPQVDGQDEALAHAVRRRTPPTARLHRMGEFPHTANAPLTSRNPRARNRLPDGGRDLAPQELRGRGVTVVLELPLAAILTDGPCRRRCRDRAESRPADRTGASPRGVVSFISTWRSPGGTSTASARARRSSANGSHATNRTSCACRSWRRDQRPCAGHDDGRRLLGSGRRKFSPKIVAPQTLSREHAHFREPRHRGQRSMLPPRDLVHRLTTGE